MYALSFPQNGVSSLGLKGLKMAPAWNLGPYRITLSDEAKIHGVTFKSKLRFKGHTATMNRIQACRKNIYRRTTAGVFYPGLDTKLNYYLWKVIGSPTLLYGMD